MIIRHNNSEFALKCGDCVGNHHATPANCKTAFRNLSLREPNRRYITFKAPFTRDATLLVVLSV
jgi:hypothetical protein